MNRKPMLKIVMLFKKRRKFLFTVLRAKVMLTLKVQYLSITKLNNNLFSTSVTNKFILFLYSLTYFNYFVTLNCITFL